MRLATLLKSRDPKALEKVEILVKTFRDSLIHEDSYIYLAAVEGLVAAADVRADDVIPRLAREFMACCEEGTEATGSEEDKGEYKGLTKGESHVRRVLPVLVLSGSSCFNKRLSLLDLQEEQFRTDRAIQYK
jgi:hypothetical protein